MILKLFVIFSAACVVSWGQRQCSRDRMRQCEDSLRRDIQRRIVDMTRSDMTSQCENVRDDFNCLLTETRCLTSESERNRNGDTLRNALKYIRDGCDTATAGGKGSWRDSTCYTGDTMKNCESSYPLGGVQYASYNPETCRKYNLFYDCAMDTVRNRCRREDERLLGQYLVDSAQDLAWNCGDHTSTSDYSRDDRNRDDRTRDDQYGRRGGNDRYNDRERDGYRSGGGGSGGSYNDRYGDRDRDRNGGYGRNDYSGTNDVSCCRNERCERYRMQQCRDSLSRTIDNRISGYQDSQKCRKTRDDFNCLMWHTSSCANREDRDRDNDIFRRARDYISRNCDSYGRWTDNSCYKTTEMQRCEALLSNTRGGANYEACRSFSSFKECMSEELARRCTREDDLYQGAYLVDKAQELSWQCSASSDANNGRNQYSTFDRNSDRNRDRDGGYDRDGYGYDRDRDGYDNSPLHLEDDDAMCASRIQSYSDQCKDNMEEKKRDLYAENDFDIRARINCCAIRQYRQCLYDVTRRYCQTERSRVVDSLMAGLRHHLSTDACQRVYDSDCSATQRHLLSLPLLVACLAILSALFAFKH